MILVPESVRCQQLNATAHIAVTPVLRNPCDIEGIKLGSSIAHPIARLVQPFARSESCLVYTTSSDLKAYDSCRFMLRVGS